MKEYLKYLKSLISKGFATKAEKLKAKEMSEELDDEDKELVEDKEQEVADLPEEKEGGEGEDDDEATEEVEKIIGFLVNKKVDEAKESLKDFIAEHEALAKKKAGLYQPEVKAQRAKLNEYALKFCKSVMNGSIAKEMTTDDTGTPYAGYTVDSELAAEIRHIMTEYGTAIREFESIQLSKNSYKTNELVTDVVTYWVDEAGSIKSSETVLGQNTLELKKMAVIVAWTNELLEDTEIDFISFMGNRVAESFAEREDEAFFNGDGTSTYGGFTGLLNSSSVNTVTMTGSTFASIDPDDLLAMMDATPSGALKNAKFYMHRSIWSLIRKHKDSNNAYIFQEPSATGPATAWGFPVLHVEVFPTTADTAAATPFVIFGDLKKGALRGYKGGMKVTKSDQATIRNVDNDADINLFTSDRVGIRWTQRVGYIQTITNNKKPITVLKTAAASA